MRPSMMVLIIMITLTEPVKPEPPGPDDLAGMDSDSEDENADRGPQLSMKIVQKWADSIAEELWNFGEYITRRKEVHNSFKELAVTQRDGKVLVDRVAEDMRKLLTSRMDAALRIAKKAEDIAEAARDLHVSKYYQYYGSTMKEEPPTEATKDASKKKKRSAPNQSKKILLTPTPQKYTPRNDKSSAVNHPMDNNNPPKLITFPSNIDDLSQPSIPQDEPSDNESDYDLRDLSKREEPGKTPIGEEVKVFREIPCSTKLEDWAMECHLPRLAAKLTWSRRFEDKVNMSMSSVQVAGDSYDWRNETIKAIQWSEKLDSVFRKNFREDPLMALQYFGSAHGFLRHYPALHWTPGGPSPESIEVDIYDARFRSWYLEAAATPRDVLILLDSSGSMNGTRREIGHKLLEQLLRTLGDDDFFNVYRFSESMIPVVPCFKDTFVQATYGNKREVISVLTQPLDRLYKTENFAKYEEVLPLAFEQFRSADSRPEGGHCNKAMVIITDEIPDHYEDIFRLYNKDKSIRMFTFLLGIEVTNTRPAQWIACAHRGHFAQLISHSDVHDRALDHVNVLARPLVMQRVDHHMTWTGLYAHAQEPIVADFLWKQYEDKEQIERYGALRKGKEHFLSPEERQRRYLAKMKLTASGGYDEARAPYTMLTTVSTPAYDTQKYINITYEDEQGREGMDITKTFRIARLLGVAGVDVLLQDLYHLTRPHLLGVNGYAFLINNNGHVLLHPDIRPYFRGILKPNYRNVDLVELELLDDDREPRNFSSELIQFRKDVLEQDSGSLWMLVKYHMDNMRIVSSIRRQYFWRAVKNTAFVVGIVLPEPYGLARAAPPYPAVPPAPHRATEIVQALSVDDNWLLHPDWLYCRHRTQVFESPRHELMYFLNLATHGDWHWPARPPTLPKNFWEPPSGNSTHPYETSSYYCDGELVSALLHDVQATAWFEAKVAQVAYEEKGQELLCRFGPTTVFLATHSGLTRWQNVAASCSNISGPIRSFGELHPFATDEAWYRRAVEQHFISSHGVSYTVEASGDWLLAAQGVFARGGGGAGVPVRSARAGSPPVRKTEGPVRASGYWGVRGTTARGGDGKGRGSVPARGAGLSNIEVTPVKGGSSKDSKSGQEAPVAAFGFRFRRDHLQTLLEAVTSECADCPPNVATCSTGEHATWRCLLLESSGRIVAGAGSGRALADIRPRLMQSLVASGLYRELRVPDYQGVCFRDASDGSPASRLVQPLTVLLSTVRWIGEQLLRLATWYYALALDAYTLAHAENDETTPATSHFKRKKKNVIEVLYDRRVNVNRTTAQACDRTARAWQLNYTATFGQPPVACHKPFTAHRLPDTNLLLLVFDSRCHEDDSLPITDERPEFVYNSSLPCARRATSLYRKRPGYCHFNAVEENEGTMMCSKAAKIMRSTFCLMTGLSLFSKIPF